MTKDKALKLALEALHYCEALNRPVHEQKIHAITATKEALAQPAQEAASIIQAVTDPENQPSQYGTVTLDYHLAKLKEWEDRFEKLSDKALAQPAQETKIGCVQHDCDECKARLAQRQWVGLSEVEVDNFHRAAWSIGVKPADFIRAIEAKLKEKNT